MVLWILIPFFGRTPVRKIPGLMKSIEKNQEIWKKLNEFQQKTRLFFAGKILWLISNLYLYLYLFIFYYFYLFFINKAGKWRKEFEVLPKPKLPYLGPIQTELGEFVLFSFSKSFSFYLIWKKKSQSNVFCLFLFIFECFHFGLSVSRNNSASDWLNKSFQFCTNWEIRKCNSLCRSNAKSNFIFSLSFDIHMCEFVNAWMCVCA